MKRSKAVPLALTAMAASTLTGCAGDTPEYQAICVSPVSHERVDDDQCDDDERDYSGNGGDNDWFWFYMATRSNRPLPAVGSRYNDSWGSYNGSKLSKNHSIARGGAPKSGAKSVKSFTKTTAKSGGFGGRSSSSS